MGYKNGNKNREMAQIVLSKIVAAGGSCIDNVELCPFCPLKNQAKRPDGSWASCLAAVLGENYILELTHDPTWASANDKYLKAAQKILADMAIEDMLGGQDEE